MAKQYATVFNKATGQRKRVEVGDPNAFRGGFELEKKSPLDKTLSGTRSLPDDLGSEAAFGLLLRKTMQELSVPKKSAIDKLREVQSITGVDPAKAGLIAPAVSLGQEESAEAITRTAKDALALFREQEERKERQRKENLAWAKELFDSVENPFSVFSSEDIENMKLGITTPEMKAKAAKARSIELGRKGTRPIQAQPPEDSDKMFKEFIQKKSEELRMSIANPEKYRSEFDEIMNDITTQMQGREIRGKAASFSFLNQVIKNNPGAKYEELYILARTRMPDLSVVDVETYLKSKGFAKQKATSTKANDNPWR